ncbi:MAG: 50S ribosomal protein L6 [Gammaproteobacteria bacterium]|nr:50S ribosomal protein L6 [Gammaproteobacteria bacterium]MDE0252426.1 50S ribosomal protein L6 [Gammaproteobacteria bacterium]MDE0402465.1 50S ribosomal protein L6 [Gammaproteobacteria bacterium]
MSRITERQIEIPQEVDVKVTKEAVVVKGKHGQLSVPLAPGVSTQQVDHTIQVRTKGTTKQARAMTGTHCALIKNMIVGVSQQWEKRLQLEGIGYRAQLQGTTLVMQLGYSHPVNYDAPQGVSLTVPSPTEIVVTGTDRQLVGQIAAEIRSKRPPEPYKGKGVRYVGEYIKRKEVKK